MSRTPFALALVALLPLACADSRSGPLPDRQTHWMHACDATSECGVFECLCGRCNLRCDDDTGCAEALDGAGTCVATSELPVRGPCHALGVRGVCLPACDRSGDCPITDDGLECRGDVCLAPAAETSVNDPTAALDGQLELSCADLKEGTLAAGVQLVAAGTILDLQVTPSGVYWATPEAILRADSDGSNQAIVAAVSEPSGSMAVAGDQVVWLETHRSDIRLRSVSTDGGDAVELSRLVVTSFYAAHGVALAPDSVLWLADGRILRSPRTSGPTTTVVADQAVLLPNTLAVSSTHVYYMSFNETQQETSVRRVPIDGSGSASEDLVSGGIYGMTLAAGHVYYSDAGDSLPATFGEMSASVARLPIEGARAETLASDLEQPLGLVVAGSDLYWFTYGGLADGRGLQQNSATRSHLWRMPADGSTDPVPLLGGDMLAHRLVAPEPASDHIYWLTSCVHPDDAQAAQNYLLRVEIR